MAALLLWLYVDLLALKEKDSLLYSQRKSMLKNFKTCEWKYISTKNASVDLWKDIKCFQASITQITVISQQYKKNSLRTYMSCLLYFQYFVLFEISNKSIKFYFQFLRYLYIKLKFECSLKSPFFSVFDQPQNMRKMLSTIRDLAWRLKIKNLWVLRTVT